ncbi:MAG TPA: hypothetical protein VLD62_04600 [Acidimicrobiia bacterium]|nr:hypothetical protein [Acidimicrobiia bacterium]
MTAAGWLLIAGFVAFMTGAGAWRLEFQLPLPERFPHVVTHRTRLRWIHTWMLVAMVLTPAGLAAAAAVSSQPVAWAAATAYAIGALPWIGELSFRLTVAERVAGSVAAGSAVPDWYRPLEAWAALGHRFHMLVSYATAVPLAWGLRDADLIPGWLAWAGAAWGAAWLIGYAVPRTRFAFEPPFWAHVFTFAVGIALV